MDRYEAQLRDIASRMPDSEENVSYKSHLMRNRSWFENFYKATGKGGLKAAESAINFVPDLLGAKDRFATFSDYIEDNPESMLFQVVEDTSQLGFGLATTGPIVKGVKALTGLKTSAKQLRDRQLKAAGKRGSKERLGSKAWNIAKEGGLRGGVAEMLAFRGQDEALFIELFFEKNPPWKQAIEEVTAADGWENQPTSELGKRVVQSVENMTGRALFAAEGAFMGALANYLIAGAKVSWRAVRGDTTGGLKKAVEGKDLAGEAAADATEGGKVSAKEAEERELKLAQQEDLANAELSKANDELIEARLNAREGLEESKPVIKDENQRDLNIVPEEADDIIITEATTARGINPEVYTKEPLPKDANLKIQYEPLKGSRTGFEGGVIKVDREAIDAEFSISLKDRDAFTGDNSFNASDIFDDVEDYQRYLIEKEKAKQFYPQLKKETDKGYAKRVERHAINEAKRKGLGHFYKYEFDAPPKMKHLELKESELELLFKKGKASGAKKLIDMLTGKSGVPASPQALLKQMEEVMRLDTAFTDQGMQYFTGRFMKFFIHHYSKNMARVSDADTFAKAVGYLHNPEGMGLDEIMEEHLFDSIDDMAAAHGLSSKEMLHRVLKGRGAAKNIFTGKDHFGKKLNNEEILSNRSKIDERSMKELNVRIMAYRMEQAIGMKRYRDLSKQVANMSIEDLNGTAAGQDLLKKYLLEMEKQNAKIESLQKLRKSSGRVLRAWRDFNDVGMTGIQGSKLLSERGGLKNIKKHAQRTDAIFEAGDNTLDSSAAAGDYLAKSTGFVDIHNEYWLNSILSSTKTQVVNLLSNSLSMYYKPLEGILGTIGKSGLNAAEKSAARKGFTKAFVQTALIHAQVTRVLAKLGLNKIKNLFDEDGYMSGREDIFKSGSGEANSSYQQALGAVAGARKSLRTGEGTLTKGSDIFDTALPEHISGDLLGDNASNLAKNTLDYIGNMVRIPSKLMVGSDELFKQITFRSAAMGRLTADAYELALERGMKPHEIDSKGIADYVGHHFSGMIRASGRRYSARSLKDEARAAYNKKAEAAMKSMTPFEVDKEDFVEDYIKKQQRGFLEDTSNMAMDYAEDVTFTRSLDADLRQLQELGDGSPVNISKTRRSFLQDTQDMVHQHPWMRLLMPFIRTPVNLLKWPLQRMPMVMSPDGKILNKEFDFIKKLHLRYQADMASGDTMRAAAAKGRVNAGWFYWFGFASAAASGTITGAGPSNPRERRNLMATGWRPYSVRVGDKYISYSRLDPFASALGLAADMYEKVADLGQEGDVEDDWMLALMMGGAYSLSNNMADKSYLAGINNVLKALIDPEHEFESLIKRQGSSYIPKIISQWTPITDDNYMKKTYGILEGMTVRVPFANQTVEPMRNYLGEPMEAMYGPTVWASGINPFLVSKAKDDPVLEELANVGYGFGAPSPRIKGSKYLDMRKYHDPDTGRSAFDRYQELIGEIKTGGGKTLRDKLTDLFKHRHYKRASLMAERGLLQFEGTYRDPRVKTIKALMAKWRAAAKVQVLREYPDLLNAVKGFDESIVRQMQEITRL